MNYSKRPAVSLNALPMFENALTMFCNDLENGFATHFGSVEKHCQRFKMQWKCSSTHFQRVENALQRKNASTLFSLSLLFPNRVTYVFQESLYEVFITDCLSSTKRGHHKCPIDMNREYASEDILVADNASKCSHRGLWTYSRNKC